MQHSAAGAGHYGGHIVERGTHAALLAANGRYAQMWALQQSGE